MSESIEIAAAFVPRPFQGSNRFNFDRTLVFYALAGTAVTSAASAGVVHSGVKNLSLSAGTPEQPNSLGVDIDGDGGDDLTFSYQSHNASSLGFVTVRGNATTAFIGSISAVFAFSDGETIGETPPAGEGWQSTFAKSLQTYDTDGNAERSLPGGELTLGFRLQNENAGYHYGYMNVTLGATDSDAFMVNDWYYETTSNQAIVVGASTGGVVPGPVGLAAFAAGACGLRGRRKRSSVA